MAAMGLVTSQTASQDSGSASLLCSIPDKKDHTTVRAALLEPSSYGLRDFARTHRAHAGASCGGRIA